jgi:hypothetical protein
MALLHERFDAIDAPDAPDDDDGDVLRVRHQPGFHDVLAVLQAPEDTRAVVNFERGH